MTNFAAPLTVSGVPVFGGARALGWKFGSKSYFVDGVNGDDAYEGLTPETAFATVGGALAVASAFDVVYVLDHGQSGTDPDPYQEADANLTVAYAANNLSLIGVPNQPYHPLGIQIKGHASATTAVLTWKAPFGCIENLAFNRGASTTGGVYLYDVGSSTALAYGTAINNCFFRNLRGATNGASGGGVVINGGWDYTIANSQFFNCRGGIVIDAGTSTVQDVRIWDCKFYDNADASVDTDICIAQTGPTVYGPIEIKGCYFSHEVPAYAGAGALAAYIYAPTALTDGNGLIANCYFSTDDASCNATTSSDIVIHTDYRITGCYDEAGLIARA